MSPGKILFNGNVLMANPDFNVTTDTCTDTTGKSTDHPLSISHSNKVEFVPFNGRSSVPIGLVEFQNFIPSSVTVNDHNHLALPSAPSDSVLATTVLSRTNPSRPVVSIPNFLYELKDLPSMIRDIGSAKLNPRTKERVLTPKGASNHYLAAQFGWVPLINDLRKLMQFQTSVDKKVKELKQLYDKGGISRTYQIHDGRANVVSSSTFAVDQPLAFYIPLTSKQAIMTQRVMWGSVRWELLFGPKHVSNAELQKMARKLVFGLNLSPAALWQAMPWSWLIDWFTNTGDLIGSFSNAVPVVPSNVCIMTTTNTIIQYDRADAIKWVQGGVGLITYTTKERRIVTPALSASIPILSGYQLSILGALAIQRA